jgi:hypothetical protein
LYGIARSMPPSTEKGDRENLLWWEPMLQNILVNGDLL